MATNLSDNHADLSEAVNTLMERATDTQAANGAALARALDQHAPNVRGKIKNERAWSLDDLFDLAEHYRVPPDALVRMMLEARTYRERKEEEANQYHERVDAALTAK